VAVAVVAVAGWVGASWYTGMQVEENLRKAVSDANAANWGATTELVSYERNVFNSRSRYRVTLPRPDGEPLQFTVENAVNHGPFPLDRLQQLQLKPVSATAQSFLVRDEGVGAKLQTVEPGATVRASSVIDLNQNVVFDLGTPAMRFEQDGGVTELAAGSFAGTTVKASSAVNLSGKLASLRASSPEPKALVIDMRDLTISVDSQVGRFGMQVGDSAFRVGSFALTGPTPDEGTLSVTANDVGVAWHLAEDEKFMNGHLSYNLGKLAYNKIELGDFDLRLVARQLDGVATARLATAYRDMIVKTPPAAGPDAMLQAMTVLQAPLQEVLAAKPVLSLDSLIWTTPIGQSTLKIDTTLSPPDPASPRPGPGIERATLDLSVSQTALVDLLARFAKTGPGGRPITLTQANEQATMQVRMMTAGPVKAGLLSSQGDKLESHAVFDGKSVLVNGKEPPPQLLQSLLGMVP
jgi:uncharacterized protein YdgA (DUF945 family)